VILSSAFLATFKHANSKTSGDFRRNIYLL